MSRVKENKDVLHMMLCSSDLYISSIRTKPKTKLHEVDDVIN